MAECQFSFGNPSDGQGSTLFAMLFAFCRAPHALRRAPLPSTLPCHQYAINYQPSLKVPAHQLPKPDKLNKPNKLNKLNKLNRPSGGPSPDSISLQIDGADPLLRGAIAHPLPDWEQQQFLKRHRPVQGLL
jgi:hypothetical protein